MNASLSSSPQMTAKVGVWYDAKDDAYKSAVEDETGTVMALFPKPTRREAEEQYKAALMNLDITSNGEVPFIGPDRPAIRIPAPPQSNSTPIVQAQPTSTTTSLSSKMNTTTTASSATLTTSARPLDVTSGQPNNASGSISQPLANGAAPELIEHKSRLFPVDERIGDGLGGGQNQPSNYAGVQKATSLSSSGKPKPPSGPPPAAALKKPTDSTVATVDERPRPTAPQSSLFQPVSGSNEKRTLVQPQPAKASVAPAAPPAVQNSKPMIAPRAASIPAPASAPIVSTSRQHTAPPSSLPGKSKPQAPPFPPPATQNQASTISANSSIVPPAVSSSSQPKVNISAGPDSDGPSVVPPTTALATAAQSSKATAQPRTPAPNVAVPPVTNASEKMTPSATKKEIPASASSSTSSALSGPGQMGPGPQSTPVTKPESVSYVSSTIVASASSVAAPPKSMEKTPAQLMREPVAPRTNASNAASLLKGVSSSAQPSSNASTVPSSMKGDALKPAPRVASPSGVDISKSAPTTSNSTLPRPSAAGAVAVKGISTGTVPGTANSTKLTNSAPPKPNAATSSASGVLSSKPSIPATVQANSSEKVSGTNVLVKAPVAPSSSTSTSPNTASTLVTPKAPAITTGATGASGSKVSPTLPSSAVPPEQGGIDSLSSAAGMSVSQAPPVLKCSCQLCSRTTSERSEIWSHARECKRPRFCGVPFCEKLQENGTTDMTEAFSALQRAVHPPPIRSSTALVRRTGMLLPPAMDFTPIPADFALSDSTFFGDEHILPASTVLMTGVYHPETQTLIGRWTTLVPNQLRAGEPACKPFNFECSNEDVIDRAGAKPCKVCNDVKNGPETKYQFLMCDLCNQPFHLGCVGLQAVPIGEWFCGTCSSTNDRLGERALPPTRNWKGRFHFFVDSRSMVWKKDSIDFVFDYSQARGNRLATISGEGKNEFGAFAVRGVLVKSSDAYVFQFSKTFVVNRARSPTPTG